METKTTFYNNFGEAVWYCYSNMNDPYAVFNEVEKEFLFKREPDRYYYIVKCTIEIDMSDRIGIYYRCYDQYARVTHYGVDWTMKKLGKARNGKDN